MALELKIFSTRTTVYDPSDDKIYLGQKREYVTKMVDGVIQLFGPEGISDYPLPKYVLDGKSYANGDEVGIAGAVNNSDMDITKQIRANAENYLMEYLTDYRKLDYSIEIQNNEKNNSRKRFSINVKELDRTDDNIGSEFVNRRFEVLLMDKYINKGKSDKNQLLKADDLREKMEELGRRFRESNFGSFGNVINTKNYEEAETEYVAEESLVIVRMGLTVTFEV